MSEPIAVIKSDRYLQHVPPYVHPERPERLLALYKGIEKVGGYEVFEPFAADPATIELVHTPAHIARIRSGDQQEDFLELDTYCGPTTYEVARLAVGGAIKACELVAEGKFRYALALVRPPGHHALCNRSKGFCIFNNVAIAARYMNQKGKRVAILDIDAHHGDGTQSVLYGDPILYCSLHEWGLYPGTGLPEETGTGSGAGLKFNVPLKPGTEDEEYLEKLGTALRKIEEFRPDLLLVSLGFDAHQDDPQAGLCLTTACYGEIFRRLKKWPLAIVLEGGYNLQALEDSIVEVMKALQ